jgi:hypothetical protein
MSDALDSPIPFRPLLRLAEHGEVTALQIASHSYGGIVLEASTPFPQDFDWAHELARECRAQSLEVWLDVSQIHSDELPRWKLEFDGAQPRFGRGASTLLDCAFRYFASHRNSFRSALARCKCFSVTGVPLVAANGAAFR